MGTGHGWAAAHSVLWNCDVTNAGIIGLQKPPTAQNYAIGCTAKSITGKPVNDSNFPIGYVELQNKPVTQIPSLYLAQLKDRLKQVSGIAGSEIDTKLYNIKPSDNGKVNLTFLDDASEKKEISIFNMQGKKLSIINSSAQILGLNFPASGMYIIHIRINQKTYSEKIIIQL